MAIKRHIRVGGLIDGSGGPLRKNMMLTIADTRFVAIEPYEKNNAPDPVLVTNLNQCTIVPALVDCSVSLSRSPSVDRRVRTAMEEAGMAAKEALVKQHIGYCHSHGVLGVADSEDSISLQQDLAEGISIEIRASGTDFLRIDYSGSIDNGEEPDSSLARKDLCLILQQRRGKKAVVVANGEQGVQEALEEGCDAIEQGYGMGEDNLRKMAEKDVLWIPRMLMAKNALDSAGSGGDVNCRFSMRYVAPGKADPGAETFWKKMLAGQLAQLRSARKLGVKTAVGTGAGSAGILQGESVVEEMKLFIKAGWSLEETIRCASDNGARFFGMENLGVLTVGRKATFLVARGAVQQLPRKLAYLESVYVDGIKWKIENYFLP
jgi:imidazolonepropionase-like amidohydrolase